MFVPRLFPINLVEVKCNQRSGGDILRPVVEPIVPGSPPWD